MLGRSLRARLVLLVLIPSIPVVAITAWVAHELRSREIAGKQSELKAFAGFAATDLRHAAMQTRDLLELLARVPAVALAEPVECAHLLASTVQSAPRFAVLFLADANGRAICHSEGTSRLAQYGDRAYIAALRDGRDFFAGQPLVGRVSKKPLLATSLAVRGDQGELERVLVSGLDLRWFGDDLVRRLPNPGLSLALWAPDGTILYRHPEPERWIGRKAPESGIAQAVAAREGAAAFVEAADLGGRPELYALRGVEDWSGQRMTISVGADRQDVLARADAILRRSLLAFGIVFAIALATALALGEFGIRRRAAALTRASARLAAGDLSARTGVRASTDELGQLAASFDRMAATLQSTQTSVRMLSEGGKALVRAEDEQSLLRDICRVVVEHGGFRACWAGRAEDDPAKTLRAMASWGMEPGYLESLRFTWDDREEGRGPNGTAVRTGAPVVVRDTRADPVDEHWRRLALARGYGSYAALPIRTGEGVYGALGVSALEPGRFGDAEIGRLMELADDLGFGIRALRTREELDRHAHGLEALVGERTAQLQSANRFLDSLIENIPDMIFVKEARELRFVRLNRAGEELLGLARDKVVGRRDHDIFPAAQADFFAANDHEVLAGGAMREIAEEPVGTPAGTRVLHTKKIPVAGDDGRTAYLLGISRDITQRLAREREILALNAALAKRAAELDAANRELEAFSYSVSHDLRAPLRHVQGYIELLSASGGTALDDKSRRYLSVISDSAREMGALIDDLLMFSRTSRTEMRRAPVALDALVAEVLRGLEMQASGRRIDWRIAPLPRVMGDAGLLRQVWVNLLGNAIKYTRGRDPAVIEIGVEAHEAGLPVFHVRDNGVGFDMRHAAKLFGVFQRMHRADEFEGTGIGLAIAHRIIARHGGRIWAHAEPDAGATFHFTLIPAPDGAGPPHQETP